MSDRNTLLVKLQGFDAAHYARTERYARQIEQLCDAAAKEYAQLYANMPLFEPDENKPFSFDDFPGTKKKAQEIATGLANKLQCVITRGSKSEWLAATYKNDAFLGSILRTSKLTKEELQQYEDRNLEALKTFQERKTQGLDLSQRVWKYTGELKDAMELGIDAALGEGKSAQQLSRDLRGYLREPNRLYRRVRDKGGNLRLSKAASLYHPGQGVYRSSAKNAQRLARTEINMAYRESEYLRWQQLDFVVGFRVELSNNHTVLDSKGKPKPLEDICDKLAGDYPKTFKFLGWHPNCRCIVTPILKDYDEYNKERGNRLKAIVRGETYKSLPSRRTVTTPPQGFTDYIAQIAERSKGWKSQPYYIRDNFLGGKIAGGLKNGIATKPIITTDPNASKVRANVKICTEYDAAIKTLKRWAYAFGLDVSKLDILRNAGKSEELAAEVSRLQDIADDRQEQWLNASTDLAKAIREVQAEGMKELAEKYGTIRENNRCDSSRYYAEGIQALKNALIQLSAERLKLSAKLAEHAKDGMPKGLTEEEQKIWIKHQAEVSKGLGIAKGTPMSVEEADKQNANPNYGKGHQYSINCQTCAPAYALRRLGFDVWAKGNTRGSKLDYLSRGEHVWEVWKNIDGSSVEPTRMEKWLAAKNYTNMTTKRFKQFFEESCKEPGIYEVSIGWKGGGGHATIIERTEDGKLVRIEPQMDNSKGGKYEYIDFDRLCQNGSTRQAYCRGVLRIDNKLFNLKFLDIFSHK